MEEQYMHERFDAIMNAIMDMKADIELMKMLLIGNGIPGLVDRVVVLEEHDTRVMGVSKFIGWAVPIGVALVAVIVGVWELVRGRG